MKNKKAQLGKIIATPFVLIAVFVIMGIFVIAAGAMTILDGPETPTPSTITVSEDNLLLKKIPVTIENEKKEMLILDSYSLYQEDIISKEELKTGLSSLLTAEKRCLVLAKSDHPEPVGKTGGAALDDFFMRLEDNGDIYSGHTGSIPSSSVKYKNENLLSKIIINNKENKKIFIEYYYGKCLE
jgi:hypothetical protein